MQLGGVPRNIPEILSDGEGNLDIFGERISQDFDYLLDQLGVLKLGVFTLKAAGEREYLFDHLAAADGICVQDVEQAQAAFILNSHLKKLNGGQYGCEDIVQIVRDSTGKRADALHPLGSQKL